MKHYIRIKLPIEVLSLLMDDAKRCKRTVPQQIEAILCTYTETENVSLGGNNPDDILDAEVIE